MSHSAPSCSYVDPDAGRAPGVPYGVGQGLLREPVDRGVHGSRQPGQRTGQRDLDGVAAVARVDPLDGGIGERDHAGLARDPGELGHE